VLFYFQGFIRVKKKTEGISETKRARVRGNLGLFSFLR
jgi:hypothetical protein